MVAPSKRSSPIRNKVVSDLESASPKGSTTSDSNDGEGQEWQSFTILFDSDNYIGFHIRRKEISKTTDGGRWLNAVDIEPNSQSIGKLHHNDYITGINGRPLEKYTKVDQDEYYDSMFTILSKRFEPILIEFGRGNIQKKPDIGEGSNPWTMSELSEWAKKLSIY